MGADEIINEAVELCPYCSNESVYPNWDVEKQGYIAKCQHCGKEIMLCDECTHSDDYMYCDWERINNNDDISSGTCFRMVSENNNIQEDNRK